MSDDQPIWGNNQAVAPTPGVAIIAVNLGDNFTVKGGNIIQIFYHGLDEATQAILNAGGIFLYKTPNKAHQLLEDRVLLKLDCSKDIKAKPIWKTIAFAESSDNSQLMEKMEALTTKIKSQFKDIKGEMKEMQDGCNSCRGPHPSSECDDKPMGGPKEKKPTMPIEDIEETTTIHGPLVNSNAKTTIIHDDSKDEADKAEKEVDPSSSKQNKSNPPPLKAYKLKIPYP
ncbi:hypothetical protein Tco_0672070 [Tanacetum coccineum]